MELMLDRAYFSYLSFFPNASTWKTLQVIYISYWKGLILYISCSQWCPYIVNIDCHAVPLLSDLPNKHKQSQLQSHKSKHQQHSHEQSSSHKQSHNVSANKHSPVSKSKPSSVNTSSTPAADKQQGSRKSDNKKKPPLFVHGKQHLINTKLVGGLQWAMISHMQLLEPTSQYSN